MPNEWEGYCRNRKLLGRVILRRGALTAVREGQLLEVILSALHFLPVHGCL